MPSEVRVQPVRTIKVHLALAMQIILDKVHSTSRLQTIIVKVHLTLTLHAIRSQSGACRSSQCASYFDAADHQTTDLTHLRMAKLYLSQHIRPLQPNSDWTVKVYLTLTSQTIRSKREASVTQTAETARRVFTLLTASRVRTLILVCNMYVLCHFDWGDILTPDLPLK